MTTEQLIERIGGLPAYDLKDSQDYWRGLIYGKVRSGKTYLSATACEVPEMCPILYLDIEGGFRTIKANFPEAVAAGLFHVITPQDRYSGGKIIEYKWPQIERVMNDLKEQASRGVLKYNTFIIDSLS